MPHLLCFPDTVLHAPDSWYYTRKCQVDGVGLTCVTLCVTLCDTRVESESLHSSYNTLAMYIAEVDLELSQWDVLSPLDMFTMKHIPRAKSLREPFPWT